MKLNGWPKFMLCSPTADISGWWSQLCWWHFLILVSMEWPVCPLQTLIHSQTMLYTLGIFKPMSSLMGQRKLATFLGRRPTVLKLYFDSIQLMWLEVGPTKSKKPTDVRSSLGISSLSSGLRTWRFCHYSHSVWLYYGVILIRFLSIRRGLHLACSPCSNLV